MKSAKNKIAAACPPYNLDATGISSVQAFVKLTPEEIIALYEKKNKKKADFTESDIGFALELARELKHLPNTG